MAKEFRSNSITGASKVFQRTMARRSSLFHSIMQVAPSTKVAADPEQEAKLRAAFELIDEDGSGTILADGECRMIVDQQWVKDEFFQLIWLLLRLIIVLELGKFLSVTGTDIAIEDLEEIMKEIDVDGEEGLDFNEFQIIMKGIDLQNMGASDLALSFSERARARSKTFQANDPLWKSMGKGEPTVGMNARMQLAMVLDGTWAQMVVLGLILLDVLCVICELLLVATMCPCGSYPEDHSSSYASYASSYSSYSSSSSSSHRRQLLASGNPDECHKGDYVYSEEQTTWHDVLHYMSVSILCIFGLQILLLIGVYRFLFFQNFFYVLDLIVIGGALFLELTPYFMYGSMFALIISWRVLRVVHGVLTSIELEAKKREVEIDEDRAALRNQILKVRRELGKSKVFFFNFFTSLEKRGVTGVDNSRVCSSSFDAPLLDRNGRRSGKYSSVRLQSGDEEEGKGDGAMRNTNDHSTLKIGQQAKAHDDDPGSGGEKKLEAALEKLEKFVGPAPALSHIPDVVLMDAYGCSGDRAIDNMSDSEQRLRRLLAEERAARSRTEAMYMSLYNFMEEHHNHLKNLNTDKKHHNSQLDQLKEKQTKKKKAKLKFRAVSRFIGRRAVLQKRQQQQRQQRSLLVQPNRAPSTLPRTAEKKHAPLLLKRSKSSLSSIFAPIDEQQAATMEEGDPGAIGTKNDKP